MKHEIIPIMADCRVGFSPPIPTINPIFSEDGKMSSAKKADVSKLDNPAWSKLNQQAGTELCV